MHPELLSFPSLSIALRNSHDLANQGRLARYRAGRLDLADLSVWAARYPEEVPTVNGEFEWIGLGLSFAGHGLAIGRNRGICAIVSAKVEPDIETAGPPSPTRSFSGASWSGPTAQLRGLL